ncbi:Proteinase inhibitor, propeptide [Akanthomyces lecanii RCEF 1005]|uniref:Proteinase inhibitor, propeptide n=1 Tax=Akanthomyces lecanii RCEF 1005 TaxID=1081108 RepID=A0A162K0W8_CORDF|nr:Proteinase inhibitor, propeptide [Akanthomyces lecanii RCEF 1005]
MKLFSQIVAALVLLPGSLAVDRKVSVIISFDDPNTPDDIVAAARQKIIDGGGQITHDYQIIKGFSAIAPEKSLEVVQTFGSDHSIRVEEDQVVTANSG